MIRFLFTAALLFSPLCHAAPKGEVEVRFLAESSPPDLGQVLLANAEARTDPFDLPVNNLSPAQIPPARLFSVWSVNKNASLASVTLPEEGKSFIVLLVPSPKGGYHPIVLRSDDPAFKGGDIRFQNLTNKTVLGFVGTSKFVLAPGLGKVVTPKGARAEKFYDVGLGVREAEGDRVLAQTRWPEDALARFYVFFYVHPETKLVAYRAVDEFVGNAAAALPPGG
ncbi:hypothetical protein HZ994_01535 [Akkermansiaceae bacterium]|nr:hypothetical protein HZ994_01535 [Akkermansiaceae bacterium]